MSKTRIQYTLSYKDTNNAIRFDFYPTRKEVYEFVSKYFFVEEIALVIMDELLKKGSYAGFKLEYNIEA